MPGGNGTGPVGQGPGTGWNRGKCNIPPKSHPFGNSGRGRLNRGLRSGWKGQGNCRRGVEVLDQNK